jgi:hypothetical protein
MAPRLIRATITGKKKIKQLNFEFRCNFDHNFDQKSDPESFLSKGTLYRST